MKKIIFAALMIFCNFLTAFAGQWEKQGDFYYLSKNNRDNFSAISAGINKFTSKYLSFDGISFWARGADSWSDYGRLNLEGNNFFSLPIRPGLKVDEVHFLAGGNFGNSYAHDPLLGLYGDNYYYGVISVTFVFQNGSYSILSAPVFWDWFHLGPGAWSKDGVTIKNIGNNPSRKDCGMYHLSFANPDPAEPLKDILVADSWLSDRPFSDVFAVTLRSRDTMEAEPMKDRQFSLVPKDINKEPADQKAQWTFDFGLEGWLPGCSQNWDSQGYWRNESFGRKGVVVLPACNWAGDKTSWIEKKVLLPDSKKITLQFSRHSGEYCAADNLWSDGQLKVIVKTPAGAEIIYDKIYSREWGNETADLSKYSGKVVILRLENHGGGAVRLSQSSSASCDAEDAVIDDLRLAY